MVMDCIRECYYSRMRLYKDRPDVLTSGRWRWCTEDAKPFPDYHRFGSFSGDDYRILEDPDIGELKEWRGFSAGRSNPRIIGQNYCGPLKLWQGGSLYSQRGTPPTDWQGVPLCCEVNDPALGGLVLAGDGLFNPVLIPWLWWTPEGLENYDLGDLIPFWPDVSGHDRNGTVPLGPTHEAEVQAGPGGLFAGLFGQLTAYLIPDLPCTDVTAFLVGTPLGAGAQRALPRVGSSIGSGGAKGLLTSGGGISYADDINFVSVAAPSTTGVADLYAWRREGDRLRLYVHGLVVSDTTIDPEGLLNFTACSQSPLPIPRTGTSWLSELIIIPSGVSDDDFDEWVTYLFDKYGL